MESDASLTRRSVRACGQLVPLRDSSSEKARVLFLSMYHLGWKTWSRYIEKYTPHCAAMEAVHIHVEQPLWMKVLNRELPRPIGRSAFTPATTWAWFMRRNFRQLILQKEFDAVFVNSQILCPGLIDICRRSGTKMMVSLDVTGPAFMRDLRGQPEAPPARWDEERAIYEAASLLVPWSTWIADSLANDFGVPRERIMVVPPTIETDRVAAHQASASGLPRIVFCGNDWRRKGGARLVEWHQRHWSDLAELHIASTGAVVAPGLKNVTNYGGVPHERLLGEILPAASIFCLPTREDMSPYAISEAQAFGIPTVTSQLGGLGDLVVHGQTGFLIPPNDDEGFIAAMTRLLKDAPLRAAMRAAALRHASERLNASIVIPSLLARIVAATRTGPP